MRSTGIRTTAILSTWPATMALRSSGLKTAASRAGDCQDAAMPHPLTIEEQIHEETEKRWTRRSERIGRQPTHIPGWSCSIHAGIKILQTVCPSHPSEEVVLAESNLRQPLAATPGADAGRQAVIRPPMTPSPPRTKPVDRSCCFADRRIASFTGHSCPHRKPFLSKAIIAD